MEGGEKRRNWACLDIPDGALLRYNPPAQTHTPLTGLKVLGGEGCSEPWSLKGREEKGTVRGKRL